MEFTDNITCDLVAHEASDLSVVNAARISFDSEHPALTEPDVKLISYLLRNRHGSPFEHGYFKFRVEAPIFVFREHHRHRAGHSYNEMSGRYTELESKFYVPKVARKQEGKPGHYVMVEGEPGSPATHDLRANLMSCYAEAWRTYEHLLAAGIAKEQARMVLPVGTFSKMIWSCNPRSLMHFIGLRGHPTAQKEIQTIAQQASLALAVTMPHTYEAFAANGFVAP